jgi:hypothetical protein
MSDLISIAITNLRAEEESVVVTCTWSHRGSKPREISILAPDWPENPEHLRAVVNAWVLDFAHEAAEPAELRRGLTDHWTLEFVADGNPFAIIAEQTGFNIEGTGTFFQNP